MTTPEARPEAVAVTEEMVEAAARAILIADGNEMMRDDAVWSRKLKLHRDTADDLGSWYLAGSSYMVDAFRCARAALEAAAHVRSAQDHGGEANEMIGEVERLRARNVELENNRDRRLVELSGLLGQADAELALRDEALAAASARATKAMEALREIERGGPWGQCPYCGGHPHAKSCELATLLSDHPAPEPGVEAGEVRREQSARGMTDEQINVEMTLLQTTFDEMRDDAEFDGHSGSPGESLYERMDELETEQRRRALQTPADGGRDGR
jgi:hypothetical protein